MKPVLFVTGHAPPDRVGAFAALHEREDALYALFGGRSAHGAHGQLPLGSPHVRVPQRDVQRLAASGRFRAVVCGTGGRIALPGAWRGARRAGVPFLLWASLWAHPRSVAHLVSYPFLRRLYAHADAVVTYGSHVSHYVGARGARNVHIAPQAVDNDFWAAAGEPPVPDRSEAFTALFVGRPAREKGLEVLLDAWRRSGLAAGGAALVLAGVQLDPAPVTSLGSVTSVGHVDADQLRNFYRSSDVLVVPSIGTATFREPWGLVVNEAMNQRLPIIATDAVGAAAGGLLRDGRNGLVVPEGDATALAAALGSLERDADLRRRMGAAGRRDVAAFSFDAWASGFSAALHSVTASRVGC